MAADPEDLIVGKFVDFSESSDLPVIQSAFYSLCDAIDLDPLCYTGFYQSLKSKLHQWKCKALWQMLDTRANLPEYANQTACKGKRVLVIGAGPVGLRVAVEAALLGAEVDVVEKRTSFSRNNVLHLWPFLIDDLRSLGAKRFYGKFCAGAIDHVCIRTVQCILLKIALVLGVKVHFPVTFIDYVEPRSTDDGWQIKVEPSSSILSQHLYDAILCADGKQQSLKSFKSKEFRAKLAIAITANFVNGNTNEEAAVEEISGVSYIYNQSFFKLLSQQHHIELENIVYYKDETHYFVMTAKKSSLLRRGVLKNDHADYGLLLAQDNISQTALEQYAKDAASYSTNGRLRNLQFATNHRGNHDVAIFDFTSLFASEYASMIMERKGKRLLMGVAGDTLLEPFWPTGSGLARGFLGAFDAAWMLKHFCEGIRFPIELIEERETLFHLLPSTTPERLQKKTNSYTINPYTRYPNLNLLVPPTDVSYLYNTDTKSTAETPAEHVLHAPPSESKIMRFHSVGAQEGSCIQAVKRKRETIEQPQTPPEIIEDINIEPASIPAVESSLIKFAKKLFGIKSSPRTTPKATPKHESQPKQKVSEKEVKEQPQSKSNSPRKSPKKKKRKSKSTPQHTPQGQQLTQEIPPPSQQPQSSSSNEILPIDNRSPAAPDKHLRKDTNRGVGGVSELARLYESGEMGKKKNNDGGSQHTKEFVKKRTANRVSVAMVIEKLERHRLDGVDTTDYEKNMAMLVDEGIEEVDAIVLEDIERLVTKKEVIQDKHDITDGVGKMRPQSNEILDEDVSPLDKAGVMPSSSEELHIPSGQSPPPCEDHESNQTTTSNTDNAAEYTLTSTVKDGKPQVELPKMIKNMHTETKPSPFTSPIRSGSKDDSVIAITLPGSSSSMIPPTLSWKKKFVNNLNLILEQFRNETGIENVKIALEIMNFIYQNISDDPCEDTYRRIRISSSRFMQCVWQYEHTKMFFMSCSWMEVDDYLVLPMEHSPDIAQSVLTRQIEIVNMVMHSKQISALIHQYSSCCTSEGGDEDQYTDSIVLKGVKKVNLDYSIKAAQNVKASLPQSATITAGNNKESTDHPWISRQEENSIMQSAAMAREWWENKYEDSNNHVGTMGDHSNNYSIYFQEEEMNVLNHLEQEMRVKVADRIKNFEGVSDDTSTGSSISSDNEEIDNGNHDNKEVDGNEEVDDMGVVKNTEVIGSEVRVPGFVRSASQDARNKWKKMDEGIPVVNNDDIPIKLHIQDTDGGSVCEQSRVVQQDNDPQLKWMLAQRMSQQLQLKKQQSKKAED